MLQYQYRKYLKLRLGSDQPRVHLALGYYYLYAYRDEDQALKQLVIAEKSLPNDLAIAQLDQLLSMPSWITPMWLSWEIQYAPLKSHPKYKKLLTNHTIDE